MSASVFECLSVSEQQADTTRNISMNMLDDNFYAIRQNQVWMCERASVAMCIYIKMDFFNFSVSERES